MNKAPKKNVIVLILILLMIIISLIHSWATFYKFLHKTINCIFNKQTSIAVTKDVIVGLPKDGVYYNEGKCVIIYSLDQPVVDPDGSVQDEFISVNYCKIIDYDNNLREMNYKLVPSITPSPHYYLYTTEYDVYKKEDGISIVHAEDDGTIISSSNYKLLK